MWNFDNHNVGFISIRIAVTQASLSHAGFGMSHCIIYWISDMLHSDTTVT